LGFKDYGLRFRCWSFGVGALGFEVASGRGSMFGVSGWGLKFWGLGFLMFGVSGWGFGVSRFRVLSFRLLVAPKDSAQKFRVEGLGLRVEG
jgi:hypothetical protein